MCAGDILWRSVSIYTKIARSIWLSIYLVEHNQNTLGYNRWPLKKETKQSRRRRLELAVVSLALTAAALAITTSSEAPAKSDQPIELELSNHQDREYVIINEGEQPPLETGDDVVVFVRPESHTDRVASVESQAKMGDYLMRLGEVRP